MPFLQTPFFLIASSSDAFQLGENVGHAPASSGEIAYANNFSGKNAGGGFELYASNEGTCAVFSWSCYNHATSCTDGGFNKFMCNNSTTMSAALSEFLGFSAPAADFKWIDRCSTFNCGGGCTSHD